MKIASWNVNGLRAVHRKEKWKPFFKGDYNIIALQETKSTEDQLPPELQKPNGYFAYFSSSKVKKGYSGVAIYSKKEPLKVEYGMGVKKFDDEGRILVAHYENFVFFNVYFPNGGGGPARLKYKLDFYDAFLKHIEKLKKNGTKIIFCGDVNTAHEEIDLARPKDNEKNTGFLPEERAWLDEVVSAGYVDVFRHFHPNKIDVYTYWDMKTQARDRNVGWRIDYFFISNNLVKNLKSFKTMSEIYGSDHCPIVLEV
ncbi:MAG: exodeoxyribonuclease III [Parcubacteria group bacterium]|nr:exodeoxyribonuclease III [Parcubacteria group bacterium]